MIRLWLVFAVVAGAAASRDVADDFDEFAEVEVEQQPDPEVGRDAVGQRLSTAFFACTLLSLALRP